MAFYGLSFFFISTGTKGSLDQNKTLVGSGFCAVASLQLVLYVQNRCRQFSALRTTRPLTQKGGRWNNAWELNFIRQMRRRRRRRRQEFIWNAERNVHSLLPFFTGELSVVRGNFPLNFELWIRNEQKICAGFCFEVCNRLCFAQKISQTNLQFLIRAKSSFVVSWKEKCLCLSSRWLQETPIFFCLPACMYAKARCLPD